MMFMFMLTQVANIRHVHQTLYGLPQIEAICSQFPHSLSKLPLINHKSPAQKMLSVRAVLLQILVVSSKLLLL